MTESKMGSYIVATMLIKEQPVRTKTEAPPWDGQQ